MVPWCCTLHIRYRFKQSITVAYQDLFDETPLLGYYFNKMRVQHLVQKLLMIDLHK